MALAGTAAHVEQVVRTWRRVDRAAEAAEDRHRHESRALHTWVDDDGTVVVRGRLTPEVGAVLRRALDAVLDAAPSPVDPDGAAEDAADEVAPTIAPAAGRRAGRGSRVRAGRRPGQGHGRRSVPGGRPRGRRHPGG